MSSISPQKAVKQQFFKMTAERAKSDYKEKLITAEAYILYLLDSHRSIGWKWTVEPREFCKTWEIPRSTFYRAIASLKSKGKLNWEVEGKITLWRGSDIGIIDCLTNETSNPTHETSEIPTDESCYPTNKIDCLTNETSNPAHGIVVPLVGKNDAQNHSQQAFEKLTDILQTDTNSTEFVSSNEEEATAPGGALPTKKNEDQETLATESEPTPQSLTSAEIFNILDNATKGICPPKELIKTLIESEYAASLIRAINLNPQWGIDMSSFRTVDEKSLRNKELRSERKSQIKIISMLPDQPDLQFLQECWQDIALRNEIKVAIAKKPSWGLQVLNGELIYSTVAVKC